MKFFIIVLLFTALSNSLSLNWVYLYGVLGTLAPFHLLFDLYSKPQIQLPRNDAPNTSCLAQEIPVGEGGKTGLSISSREYLYSAKEGTQCAYEYGLYLQRLSIFGHSHNRIFESGYHDTSLGDPVLKHDTCTLLPKQHGNLNYLLNVNCFDIEPFSKFKTFIETKVSAMKLQGFNLKLDNKIIQFLLE